MYANAYWIVLSISVIAFTVSCSVIDYRTQRIPNKLTLPMFAAGWIFQLLCPQGPWFGLLDGLEGFAIGFGMFYVLWMIGGGGGGDAKLVGALSVWLGFYKTLSLIVVSTLMVVVGTGVLLLYGMLTKGVYRTKREFMPGQKDAKKKKSPLELLQFNRGRKGMTYGLSVALATILIMSLWPTLERVRNERIELEAAKKAAGARELELDEIEGGSGDVEASDITPKAKSKSPSSEKAPVADKPSEQKPDAKPDSQPKTDTKAEKAP
jgi:prepilin peptidase CpaA